MSVCDLSVLDYLRKAAIKLELNQEDGAQDIYGLDESEIASIINQHYQDKKNVVRTSVGKRKGVQEDEGDNKKLKKAKVYPKVIANLSALEKLPNEIYEKILYPLRAEDKNSLRTTCKGLYEKTTAMDPRYNFWCFDASKGTPPDFVLNTDKKFCIKVICDGEDIDPNDIDGDDDTNDIDGDNIGNIINRFASRISSIKTDVMKKNLMNYLRSMKPAGFSNLTTLDIEYTNLDNVSLLQLAPQLENLRLFYIGTNFDLSTVTEDDKCFTKLRTLEVSECKIDVCKILTKCCNTLEHLKLDFHDEEFQNFKEFQHDLSSLKSLDLDIIGDETEKSVKQLLSKSVVNLQSLKIIYHGEDMDVYDFSTLLDQSMNITTLVINPGSNNIDNFLKNCPYVQNLTLINCKGEIKDFVLKNLTKVSFIKSEATFVSSVLRQFYKSSVRTLRFEDIDLTFLDEPRKGEFSVLPELDTVYFSWRDQGPELTNKVHKLFPPEVKIKREILRGYKIAFRREYNLQ